MRSVLSVVLPTETVQRCVLHIIECYTLAIGWKALLCPRKHIKKLILQV